jgi:hypothetical protein
LTREVEKQFEVRRSKFEVPKHRSLRLSLNLNIHQQRTSNRELRTNL